jgi:hypothetical protein
MSYKAFDVDLRYPVYIESHLQKYLGDESARLRFWTLGSAAITLIDQLAVAPMGTQPINGQHINDSIPTIQRLKRTWRLWMKWTLISVEMRVSGVGLAPANYETENQSCDLRFH